MRRGFSFTNTAREAGLTAITVYGGTETNKYLLETTGCGVAVLDIDGDGWLDIFVVNGSVLEGFPAGQAPTGHLYRNRRDGTFEDVTAKSGIDADRLGAGGVRRRLRQRRRTTICSSRLGPEPPLSQPRRRHVRGRDGGRGPGDEEAALGRGLRVPRLRPRRPPRSVRRQLHRFRSRLRAGARVRPVPLQGHPGRVRAARTDRRQERAVSQHRQGHVRGRVRSRPASRARAAPTASASARSTSTTTAGSTCTSPTTRIRARCIVNNTDGTFKDIGVEAGCAYSQDGKPQAGMGVAVGDYDRNGTVDIFKTNFAGDTSTLYANGGKGFCDDRTFAAGIGLNTRWLGWGVGFVDLDNDGWLDLFIVNGHVYPEVERLKTEAGYKQRKVVYRNLGNGRFEDVIGAARSAGHDAGRRPRRGVRRSRQRRRHRRRRQQRARARRISSGSTRRADAHWLTLKLVGTRSNRSAIGARVRLVTAGGTQVQEVRGGGSYYSQNDLRVHFGLGRSTARRARRRALAERSRGAVDRTRRPIGS